MLHTKHFPSMRSVWALQKRFGSWFHLSRLAAPRHWEEVARAQAIDEAPDEVERARALAAKMPMSHRGSMNWDSKHLSYSSPFLLGNTATPASAKAARATKRALSTQDEVTDAEELSAAIEAATDSARRAFATAAHDAFRTSGTSPICSILDKGIG